MRRPALAAVTAPLLLLVLASCTAPPDEPPSSSRHAGAATDAPSMRPPTANPPPSSGMTAFVDVTVLPMDRPSQPRLPHQTVLVDGQRIVAMGEADRIAVPARALRVDGRGKFLLPGLADMHAHLDSAATLTLLVANGVTFARNMLGNRRHLRWREEIARGDRLGPTIYTAGPIIDGEPPVWSGSAVVTTAAEATRAVAAQKRAGYDFIKIYNNLSLAAYDALVAAARREDIPLVGHVPTHVPLAHALASHQRSIEHLTGYLVALQARDSPFAGIDYLAHRRHLALHVDPSKMAPLAVATRDADVWSCVTLTVDSWFLPSTEIDRILARPEMRLVPPWLLAAWDPGRAWRERHDVSKAELAANVHAEKVLGEMTLALHRAGAGILLGTDSPNPLVVPGVSVHDELRNLVAAGLSPYDALRAATHDPAVFLHEESEWGSVEVGRRADLLLVDADPLVDVTDAARRAGVMVRGRWLDAAAIASLLASLVASYAPPADRFAGMGSLPPLAAGDRPLWSGDYRINVRDVVFGEERIAVGAHPDGTRFVDAQAVIDPPDPARWRMHAELGPSGSGDLLRVEVERPEGTSRVEAVRASGQLRVRGSTPFVAGIDLSLPIGEDRLLVGPMLAGQLPWIESALARPHTPPHALKAKTIALDPDFTISETSYEMGPSGPDELAIHAHHERSTDLLDVTGGGPGGAVQRFAIAERQGLVEYDRAIAPTAPLVEDHDEEEERARARQRPKKR